MKLAVDYKDPKFGTFYIDFGTGCFPSDDWEDFYVNILKDWKDVLSQNSGCASSTFRLYFMDGAYYLNCQKKDVYLTVQGIDEKGNKVIFNENMIFTELRGMIEDSLSRIEAFTIK